MMNRTFGRDLSRRERQIMEIIYARGQASASEVLEGLADPPSYSAVRALLRVLETKGHVRHVREGARYVYQPTQPRNRAARSALTQVVQTFFGGSVEQTVASLLSDADTRLSEEELSRLADLIEQAKEGGR
jgi:predicted transcriptional regulator